MDLLSKPIYTSLLKVSNILFLLLFLILCINNRPAADDFHFIDNVNQYGVWNGTWYEYHAWSTRWLSVFLNHSVLWLWQDIKWVYPVFFMVCLLGLMSGIRYFVKNLSAIIQHPVYFKGISSWWFAIWFANILFLATGSKGETWFWLCSTCTYLVSVICLFWAAGGIIQGKLAWGSTLVTLLSSFYIGGSNEILAVFFLGSLAGLWILSFFIKSAVLKNSVVKVKMGVAFISCLSAFIIVYAGAGNSVREQFFPDVSFSETYLYNIKVSGMFIVYCLPDMLPFLMLTFMIIALWNSHENTDVSGQMKKYWIIILSGFGFIFSVLVFGYQWPVTWVMHDIGPQRALFPLLVLLMLLTLWMARVFYPLVQIKPSVSKVVLNIALLIILSVNTYELVHQFRITTVYAKAWDERENYLNSQKESAYTLTVKALPPSGWLYPAEISADPNHFLNRHLKAGMNLKSNVSLKRD